MRHDLITIQLLNQANDAAIAQAKADERLEHQAQTMPRPETAEPDGSPGSSPWPAASAPSRHGPPDPPPRPDALANAAGVPKETNR